VALLDGEGKLVFANRGFQELLKLAGSEQLLSVLWEKDPSEVTTRLLDQHWIRLQSRPLRNGHQNLGRLVFGMDETAQREASAGRSFRSLTGLITHELKTPMTPLRLGLDQIQREVERFQKPMPEGLERVLTRMRADLESMSRRLRQFMSLAGEHRPSESLDLRRPLESAMQRSNLLQLPFVRCELRLPDEPAWVDGDPEMLAMVLTGILANALEAMSHRGQLRIHLWQESLRSGGERWLLTIQDDGRGISQDYRDHMWEPGYSTGKDGYGYGLFFARNIIQDMQGQIMLEDGDVDGTLVRIILPAREPRLTPFPTEDFPRKEAPTP
jgi:signal transduction histidine kinase